MAEEGTIKGVGILRHPTNRAVVGGKSSREVAIEIASSIKPGAIICLPNTRDHYGNYEWDFRIEPVTEEQIEVRRSDCDQPTIVESKE